MKLAERDETKSNQFSASPAKPTSMRAKPPSESFKRMRSDQTNYLNTALIFLSFLLALVLPFELFITAYVLLGPLHYLTEIGWLQRRQYFMKGRSDYRWIWILVVAVTVNYLFFKNPLVMPALTLIALFSGLIFMSVKDSITRIQLMSVTAIAVSLIVQADSRTVFFAYYLATLIHVFCFTALFMLLGCLKEKSVSSAVSLSVLILCATSLLSGVHPVGGYQSAPIFLDSALAFGSMERTLATHLGWAPSWEHGVQAMRFIAFAYTYHYLNWFSKTNVIAWHKQDRSVWTTIIVVYIGALGLYAYDFKLGLQALFLLSVGHVYLEFPLNWFSIGAIGKELTALVPAFHITSAPPVASLQQAPATD